MLDVRFNRKITKKLIKGMAPTKNMTLNHLDWLLEEKNSLCGCIYTPLIGNRIVFLVVKDKDNYKLICGGDKLPHVYGIEDIEAFLKFISIDELIVDKKEEVINDIKIVLDAPITGILVIDNDKLYLYDVEVETSNENA